MANLVFLLTVNPKPKIGTKFKIISLDNKHIKDINLPETQASLEDTVSMLGELNCTNCVREATLHACDDGKS
jgi:hypothetical protein